MSRRRRAAQNGANSGAIMGPNSALTSFLREQGISANEIRRRHQQRLRDVNEEGQEEDQEQEESEQEVDEEVEEIRQAAKRKRGANDDSENDDDDDGSENENEGFKKATAIQGGKSTCPDCDIEFIINVYSVKNNDGKFLCKNCGIQVIQERRRLNRMRNTDAVKRQKKKIAQAMLDKKEYKNIKSLQEICIVQISKYIDEVEMLGDVGASNLARISNILTRNRKLNSHTMKLFLNPSVRELDFWDCSNVSPTSFGLIPAFTPYLTHLNLTYCGQLSNDNLLTMANKLQNLTSLVLDGPFLINKETWMDFFQDCGERLTRFEVANTHRFDASVLALMVENCPNLAKLRLHKLSGLDDVAGTHLLAELSKLTHLEISFPGADEDICEDVVTDGAIMDILNAVGPQLESLVLDGCTGLTDKTMALLKDCTKLQNLSLYLMDQLTAEIFAAVFSNHSWPLTSLNVSKCIGLDDLAIEALATSPSLVELNINGLKQVTNLDPLLQCVNLTSLDAGFVPCIDDAFIRKLAKRCRQLKLVTCYGQPKVTEHLEIAGVQIIGPQQS